MTTTVSQTGYLYEITQWVQDAYRDIQNEQDQWLFRTKQGTLNCTPNGTSSFSKTTIQGQITDYDRQLFFVLPNTARYLLCYSTTGGVASAAYVDYVPYQRWRGQLDRGTIPSGQPQYFTVKPDDSLQFYPTPDTGDVTNANVYNILMDYYRTIDVLSADASTPIFPSDYHEAIAWKAIMYWSTIRQSEARYQLANREYERTLNDMRHSQLPEELPDVCAFYG